MRDVLACRLTPAACSVVYAVAIPIAMATATPGYPTDMNELAATGEQSINEYFDAVGVTGPTRPGLRYIPAATSVVSRCVDVNRNATQDDRSLNYCVTDNTVYVGQTRLWDTYRQFGSSATLSGLAHEYGHFLQEISNVPRPPSPGETIRNEDQADCVSGAFMAFLRDRGDVDLDSVERYLTATASVDAPGRDHGTAQERIASFDMGYTGELSACSRFYPATPLIAQAQSTR